MTSVCPTNLEAAALNGIISYGRDNIYWDFVDSMENLLMNDGFQNTQLWASSISADYGEYLVDSYSTIFDNYGSKGFDEFYDLDPCAQTGWEY